MLAGFFRFNLFQIGCLTIVKKKKNTKFGLVPPEI